MLSTSFLTFSETYLMSKIRIWSLQTFRKFFMEFQLSSLFPNKASTALRTYLTASGGFMNDLICWMFLGVNPLTATFAYSIRGRTFYSSAITIFLSFSIFFSSTDRKVCSFSASALLADVSCMASVI
jgi:hypothetical protein